MWRPVNWSRLKMEYMESFEIDLSRIIRLARNIDYNLSKRRYGTNEDYLNIASEAKNQIWVLFRLLVTLLSSKEIVKEESDRIVFEKMQLNFGRIIRRFDKYEEEGKLFNISRAGDVSRNRVDVFVNDLREILYGDIYEVLKGALDKNPKSKRELLYAIYVLLERNMGFFGAVTRGKERKEKMSMDFEPSYEEMLTEEGQKDLKMEFEKSKEEYEKRRKALVGG